jgi:hypothetical protein
MLALLVDISLMDFRDLIETRRSGRKKGANYVTL